MSKKFIILTTLALLIFGSVLFLKQGGVGSSFVWNLSNGGKWLLPLVGISALIDSINPCAFGILLITIAFLLSLGKVRSSILKIGGFYILGLFMVYIGVVAPIPFTLPHPMR